MIDFLNTLLKSLNNIEVKGKENMDVLLGCMFAIENKISELKAMDEVPGPIINEEESADGR